jgi:hypothetical protein
LYLGEYTEEYRLAEDEIKFFGVNRGQERRGPGYTVGYFRKKHGLTTQQAARIIRDSRGNRNDADFAALRLKGKR